ncbi:ABC transporter substrate-binding protein [Nocardioides pantholopis]|uniref:ABC transporter substrate-binding protein n=1 Tax=Nocardioides pantholopis TaxID=2483798 RepID=UPI0013DDA5D1|nr:extracellular solute-binding protein [Nocardioides pantholopis]
MAAALALALTASSCTGDSEPEPRRSPAPSSPAPTAALTFGVWGGPEEIAAYQAMVDTYNATSGAEPVTIEPYADAAGLVAAVQKGGAAAPDVYMLPRTDLAWLREERRNVPVDELLDERGVNFGDNYSRSALEAFSDDLRLQCMPYGVSPEVVYYNKRLVDFDRMERRGLQVPGGERVRWTFDQFAEAAAFASRKRRGTKGVHVPATLEGLAPFIYSGDGKVFDDADDPRSLALAGDESRAALERTLTLLRDPTVTLSEKQLSRRSALEWFKAGKLGMITGQRDLVPQLRAVPGLDFDVISMPVLDTPATVGDVTGICISARSASVPQSADFLVHALSTDAVAEVTEAGFLAPANQTVALNDAFLQPDRAPEHATVFTGGVSSMVLPPLLTTWPELDATVNPMLAELMNVSIIEDLGEATERIDEASRTVLDPESLEESAEESPEGDE